jgi:hypothetical protein
MNRFLNIVISISILGIVLIARSHNDVRNLPSEFVQIGPINWNSSLTPRSFILHQETVPSKNNALIINGGIRIEANPNDAGTLVNFDSHRQGARLSLERVQDSASTQLVLTLSLNGPAPYDCKVCKPGGVRIELGDLYPKEKYKYFEIFIRNDPAEMSIKFDGNKVERIDASIARDVDLGTSAIEVGRSFGENTGPPIEISNLKIAFTSEKNLVNPIYWTILLALTTLISLLAKLSLSRELQFRR